jgi:hypothetical protein
VGLLLTRLRCSLLHLGLDLRIVAESVLHFGAELRRAPRRHVGLCGVRGRRDDLNLLVVEDDVRVHT